MRTIIIGILIIGLGTVVAGIAPYLLRRKIPFHVLKENNEVAGYKYQVIGVIYAVLLAFVVLIVWEQYRTAQEYVSRESSQALAIFRVSSAMPEPVQGKMKSHLRMYASSVINEEWKQMEKTNYQISPNAKNCLRDMFLIVGEYNPKNLRESNLQTNLLGMLGEMLKLRSERLFSVQGSVPTVLWYVLIIGGMITYSFTLFFGTPNIKSQCLMSAMLGMTIMLVLFAIVILNHPFSGDFKISSKPFEVVLYHM